MVTFYPELARRVRSQRDLQPDLYGNFDFDQRPDRLATQPDVDSALPTWVADRAPILKDDRIMELISTATLLGDVVADPYAALMNTHSVSQLIDMLKTACREGIEAVPDAPAELAAFLAAMEATPEWIDFDLVREGARQERIPAALLAPFITRGAFIATFTNTYAALPMALTGALSGKRAARRVNETASFFAVTTLPNALDRYGPGFEAAAMVRLMHSMVRYNALKKSDKWDTAIYGMPVPQVDQMPAGMIGQYLLARKAHQEGRTEFTAEERAVVEFARYRCFLLGLPEELLPCEPADIMHVLHARSALLRHGFDDICRELVSGTMSAYLRPNTTLFDRCAEAVEKSFSKLTFVRTFCGGDRDVAEAMGVSLGSTDLIRVALTVPFIIGRFTAVQQASRIPVIRDITDAYVIGLLKLRLATYGKPEFTTDAAHYTPASH
ncbi:oxygenase MpaB family protein [Mycobacterium sp. 94-17]|uniref:oxygenase MpaB family protein n=1 Tax=Mycobacterium sp. 94-17 TaxID=2986147 RepID=UPI002D1F08BB|nr:oxygenase MpaB family protein [Mycobacterium sp. 94-17]MEB4211910.1 oxygenase MpaB family protein [Mycobacterium sp. 94-17]